MGCGESKHDVASGNLVKTSSKRSGSKKGGYDNLPSEKPSAGESNTGSTVENKINQKAAEIIEAAKVEEKFKEVKEEKKEDDKSVPSVKENNNEKVKVAEEKKEEDKLKAEVSENGKEKETTIAEIITETTGISEKSEYNTPVAKSETPKLKDVLVEEAQKEEGGELKEEIPVKAETVTVVAEEAKAPVVVAEEAKVLPAAVEPEKPSTVIAEEVKVLPVAVEAEKASPAVTEEAKVSTVVAEKEEPLTTTSAVEEKVSPSNEGIIATPAPAPVPAAKEEIATETAAVDTKTN